MLDVAVQVFVDDVDLDVGLAVACAVFQEEAEVGLVRLTHITGLPVSESPCANCRPSWPERIGVAGAEGDVLERLLAGRAHVALGGERVCDRVAIPQSGDVWSSVRFRPCRFAW